MPTVITSLNSQFGTGNLLTLTSAVADTFTVNDNAFLNSLNNAASVGATVVLDGSAPWKANINGQIYGAQFFSGLHVIGTSKATVTIGEDGSILGGIYTVATQRDTTIVNKGEIAGELGGILLGGPISNIVTNSGEIRGKVAAIIAIAGNTSVTNTGDIFGEIKLQGSTNKLINSKNIFFDLAAGINSANITFADGINTFENKKDAIAFHKVTFGNGTNTVKNSGTIGLYAEFEPNTVHFAINGGEIGLDKITNTGALGSGINLGGGTNTLNNSGSIFTTVFGSVKYSYYGGEESVDTLTNAKSGKIFGEVHLGAGTNNLTNAGEIGDFESTSSLQIVTGGAGVDNVKNTGKIYGNVSLFEGNDVFTNTGGHVIGFISMGSGDDVFKGGAKGDFVADEQGQDSYSLGAGDDSFSSFGGEVDLTDSADGGAGIDAYFNQTDRGMLINLDKVSHTASGTAGFNGAVVAATTAVDTFNNSIDIIKNFEDAYGSDFSDLIFGSAGINQLVGNAASDELWGFAGNDRLYGGGEDDYLVGGLGKDLLRGDAGADRFVYTSVLESGLTKTTRDTIDDFQDGVDKIDLSLIDSDRRTATIDDAFSIIFAASLVAGTANSMVVFQTATGFRILGETNGDGKADFSIAVKDADHSTVWDLNDFIL